MTHLYFFSVAYFVYNDGLHVHPFSFKQSHYSLQHSKTLLCIYTTFFFIPSSGNGHLGCLCTLLIRNSAAINMDVRV